MNAYINTLIIIQHTRKYYLGGKMAFLKSDSLQLLTILGTNGARIPPTLQDMEHTPSPAFLTHTNTLH